MARLEGHSSALRTALRIGSVVGCLLLLVFGLGITALGFIPSDAPGFFLRTGLHVFASGLLGFPLVLTHRWIRMRGWLRVLSAVINLGLVVHIVWLVADGSVLGFAAAVAPLVLGIPGLLNLVASVMDLARPGQPEQCRACGYDLSNHAEGVCPECGR